MVVQEFKFRYLFSSITAVLDEIHFTLEKAGCEQRVEIEQLTGLFVRTLRTHATECVIAYQTPQGKRRRLRFRANTGEQGFQQLVAALVGRRPKIDLRSLPRGEAFRLLGGFPVVRLITLTGMLVILAIVIMMNQRAFIHGLDSGTAVLDVSACRTGCPVSSRNVVLTGGHLDLKEYIELTLTVSGRGAKATMASYFIPFVPASWQKNDPVYVVVATPRINEKELDRLAALKTIPGVLRDVAEEGLAGDTRAFFESDLKLTIAPDVRLVEYGADTQADFITALAVTGGVFLVLLGINVIVFLRR